MSVNFNDVTPAAPAGKVNVKWQKDGSDNVSAYVDASTGGTGGGTVTSVGVSMPAEFSVSGSPVTSSGTIAVSKATQTANAVFAGPTTGAAAAPTFRSLVAADIPNIAESQVINLTTDLAAKAPTSRQILTGTGLSGGGDLSADRTLFVVPDVTVQRTRFSKTGVLIGVRPEINFIEGTNVTLTVADNSGMNRMDVTVAATIPVTSVFGRTGAVAAQSGDYSAAQVTNAVSSAANYADPAWITSLAWAKLAGVPATFPPSAHVHAGTDITSGIIAAARLGTGTPSASNYLRGDGSWQAVSTVSQTPWTSNIDAAGFQLLNAGNIGSGTGSPTGSFHAIRNDGAYHFVTERTTAPARKYGVAVNSVNGAFSIDDITAAANRVSISTSGQIGIGLSNPLSSLEVNGAVAADQGTPTLQVTIGQDMSTLASNNTRGAIWFDGSTQLNIAALTQAVAWRNLVLCYAGGNVGIGTAGPYNRCTIADVSRAYTDPNSGAGTVSISSGTGAQTDDCLLFGVHTGDYSWIQAIKAGTATRNLLLNPNGGNVGIGISTPAGKLHVSGSRSYFRCANEPYSLGLAFSEAQAATDTFWIGVADNGGTNGNGSLRISNAGGVNPVNIYGNGDLWLNGLWSAGRLRLGAYYLWVTSAGKLMIKANAVPVSETDGTVVGSQT